MKIYFTNTGFRKYAIKRVLEIALHELGQPSDCLEMSLSVVTPEEIKQLNCEYRNVDAVTDVLSFPTADVNRQVIVPSEFSVDSINPQTQRFNLGDVIICLQRARDQAEEYGHNLKREMCFLALHGLLHLLGYDHVEINDEKQMTELQERILNKAKIYR